MALGLDGPERPKVPKIRKTNKFRGGLYVIGLLFIGIPILAGGVASGLYMAESAKEEVSPKPKVEESVATEQIEVSAPTDSKEVAKLAGADMLEKIEMAADFKEVKKLYALYKSGKNLTRAEFKFLQGKLVAEGMEPMLVREGDVPEGEVIDVLSSDYWIQLATPYHQESDRFLQ